MPDTTTTRREVDGLPVQYRRLQSDAKAIASGTEGRTADLVWTTGAGVTRRDWMTGERYIEELDLSPSSVRMDRLQNGAPLLAVHDQFNLNAVIGVVETAAIAKGQGTARVRFAKTAEGDQALALVRDKVLRNISVGYLVHRYQKTDASSDGGLEVWRAIDWEPVEISIVPVPADAGAQFRSLSAESAFDPTTRKEKTMNEPATGTGAPAPESPSAIRAERTRVAEINRRVRGAGLDQEFADHLVAEGTQIDAACRAIVDEIARVKPPAPINPTRTDISLLDNSGGPQAMIDDMSSMLVARYGGPAPSERARQYSGDRFVDMVGRLLEVRGVRTRGLSRDEIISRAYTSTSDLPYLLENVANKTLRQGYQAAPPGTKVVARQVLARDFKPQAQVVFGEAPALQKVLEGGEYKRGKMVDGKETFTLATYGRIFGISRQAMVNDDLGGFVEMGVKMGRQGAEFESAQVTSVFTTNAAMADGGNLFNATAVSTAGGHANLATGTGSVLSSTSLAAATKSMRLQKGLDGVTPINAEPRYLVVPATLEYTALQLVTAITPTTVGDVNVFAGKLQVVVDPRLDGSSTTAWYLAADPSVIDGLIYAYLEDSPGLRLETKEGWDVDGIEWKCRLDFAAAPIDFRGLYKSAGA